MTAREPTTTDAAHQCAVELGRVACELLDNHAGPHAAATPSAYLTWENREVKYWVRDPAPSWLVALPWADGHGPP